MYEVCGVILFFYLCSMKWMRVLIIIGVIVGAGLATLNITKPDRKAHYDEIKGAVLEVVSREMNGNPVLQPFATMGTMKALEVTDKLLARGLIIRDHTFYNVGIIIYDDHLIPVSIGVMGQIHLTINQSDLEAFVKRPEFMEFIEQEGLKLLQELL